MLKGLLMLFLCGTITTPAAEKEIPDDSLIKLATNLDRMTRITGQSLKMAPSVAALCKSPTKYDLPNHLFVLSKGTAYINIYATTNGVAAMTNQSGIFPLGTVILKQKLSTQTATKPSLYTGMLKREKGYNPACGDWEFFTLSGDGKKVTARGKIESCMDCHKDYPKSDFVTKSYK